MSKKTLSILTIVLGVILLAGIVSVFCLPGAEEPHLADHVLIMWLILH